MLTHVSYLTGSSDLPNLKNQKSYSKAVLGFYPYRGNVLDQERPLEASDWFQILLLGQGG